MCLKIETLTTCYNRKQKTLASLNSFVSIRRLGDIQFRHTVVDDGGNDGTSESIERLFPEVNVVRGDGNLYWAGGMRYGYEIAITDKNFDYLLCYNDDINLHQDSLDRLIEVAKDLKIKYSEIAHAIVFTFRDVNNNDETYGGQCSSSILNPLRFLIESPDPETIKFADTLNFNLVLISSSALDKVGFLAPYFIHGGADFEYGLRLRKSGGLVIIAPGYYGTCGRNVPTQWSSENSRSFIEYIMRRSSIKDAPFRSTFRYYYHNGGFFWLFHFVRIYLNKKSTSLFLRLKWF